MAYNEKKHLYIDCCFHILNFALGTSFTDALIMACLVPPRFNKSCFVNIFPFSLSLYVIVHDPRRLVQAAFLALMTEFCILVFRVSDFQFSYKFHNSFFFLNPERQGYIGYRNKCVCKSRLFWFPLSNSVIRKVLSPTC